MKPKFFPSPSAWRAWLEEHQQKREELRVGFYKFEDCEHGRTIAQLRRPGEGK